MDWTTLTSSKSVAGSLASWANNSTLQSSASTIIQEAESWIYRRLRHYSMLTVPVSGTLTVGSDQLAIPADMLEPKNLCLTGVYFQWVTQKDEETVIASYGYDSTGARTTGTPRIYYFNQSYIQFDSPCDVAYPYLLTYYQQPAALSAVNTTNFITSRYPRLMRSVCMLGVCEWSKESGQGSFDRTYWQQQSEEELAIAQAESDRSKRSTIEGTVFIDDGDTNNRYAAYG